MTPGIKTVMDSDGGLITWMPRPAGIIQGRNLEPSRNLIFGDAVNVNWLTVTPKPGGGSALPCILEPNCLYSNINSDMTLVLGIKPQTSFVRLKSKPAPMYQASLPACPPGPPRPPLCMDTPLRT